MKTKAQILEAIYEVLTTQTFEDFHRTTLDDHVTGEDVEDQGITNEQSKQNIMDEIESLFSRIL